MKDNDFEKRIKSESQNLMRISNDSIICKDCIQRYDDSVKLGNTSFCGAYPEGKPNSIVFFDGDCEFYDKE